MEDFDYARYDHVRPIRWTGEALELLDQRKLPFETQYLTCRTSANITLTSNVRIPARSGANSAARRSSFSDSSA